MKKCKFYKDKGCCSKNNNTISKSDMGECIYGDGIIKKNAVFHCSEGKNYMSDLLKKYSRN